MPSSPTPAGSKPFRPQKLDVSALAERGERLEGQVPQAVLSRLVDPAEPPVDSQAQVQWRAWAERRAVRGGAPELWLHLQAQAVVERTCQRCLQPVGLPLSLERSFLFAPNEEQAQAWDAEREDADVLVLSKSLNLMELLEDELLLALPIVPRHEVCPQPLLPPDEAAATAHESSSGERERDNPFAILARLKRPH